MTVSGPLTNPQQAMAFWTNYVFPRIKAGLHAGQRMRLSVKLESRSLEQNARMWAMLTEVSEQIIWHDQTLTPEEWKTMFTASLKRQRVLPGIDGGFVVMGDSTSRMTVGEMADLMTLMEAFGSERNVIFSFGEIEA